MHYCLLIFYYTLKIGDMIRMEWIKLLTKEKRSLNLITNLSKGIGLLVNNNNRDNFSLIFST